MLAHTTDDKLVTATRHDAGLVRSYERRGRVGVKRVFDVAFAALALLALAPVLLALALAVRVTSPGPAFFGHRRVGRDGRQFRCWKLRTMEVDAEERLAELLATDAVVRAEWESSYKLQHDPRITPIGGFLRRTSLDELPQFWNVLRGDMSIVGPRPIVEDEIRFYGDEIGAYLAVRPGVTGPWQAFGRCSLAYEDRVLLDRHYADGFDLLLDIGIISRTVGAMFRRIGAH